jgi:hypothetical protein
MTTMWCANEFEVARHRERLQRLASPRRVPARAAGHEASSLRMHAGMALVRLGFVVAGPFTADVVR